jgi:hypothetical protein
MAESPGRAARPDAASVLAFAVSEAVDNSFGAYLRDRILDAWRVVATNAISVPRPR